MVALLSQDSDSEFGYDLSPEDEAALIQLASPTATPPRHPLIAHGADVVKSESQYDDAESLLAADGVAAVFAGSEPSVPPLSLGRDVHYPDLSRALAEAQSKPPAAPSDTAATCIEEQDDSRSPLERFRSYPKRPLTVSDLTSGAWCELQYEFTLTRLPGGRRTRTAAMRQGSKVHQALEDEVHTTVKVDVLSREDGFGLRLWNLVQGLRTLRDTGLTRELEVWGLVDGNVVNGVIDLLSHENPNPEFESELATQPPSQSLLSDYFPTQSSKGTSSQLSSSKKVYVADVKTRGSLRPVSHAVLRPAKIQLLLYHRFLSDMAAGELDYAHVVQRYGLDIDEPFSDIFLAQIGSLHDEMFCDVDEFDTDEDDLSFHGDATGRDIPSSQSNSSAPPTSTVDGTPQPGPDLLRYRTIRQLLRLVRDEIELAFPRGRESLGNMLRVQYVFRDDGRQLAAHDFPVSEVALDDYLARYMGWWRGERPAAGISDVEEAFKCRTCEFAEGCEWRDAMDREYVDRARARMLARG